MKKIILIIASLFVIGSIHAQSEKFVKAMEANIIAVDTTRSMDGSLQLANTFERIADAEKTQWLPYYYAALMNVAAGYVIGGSAGMSGGVGDKTDPLADKAEALLKKAEELTKDNSEIFVVKKMIATLRMMADPMSRYMTYGPEAAEALATAKRLNPSNPRVYLLEGQDKFYTPEQFGGSKTEAKSLFEEALKKYNAFKAESSIHPTWGKGQVMYFMNLIKE